MVDLKISEEEYLKLVKKAEKDIEGDKQAKEEAAQQELADLLQVNGDEKAEVPEVKKSKKDKLGSLDKVYGEMKSKNKKLKKEIAD